MKENQSEIKSGYFSFKDYISPSYVNTTNPKYIEIDRFILFRNNSC